MKVGAIVVVLALVTLIEPVASAPGDLVASGEILIGGPHTYTAGGVTEHGGVDGIDGFAFTAPPAGTIITTVTTDGSGTGYDIDIHFYTVGGWNGDCATVDADETCTVPAGVTSAFVEAYLGALLSVQVIEV